MDREDYYKSLGWIKSPFIKSTSLDIPIIQREKEYRQLCESVGGWDRIILVTAPIGYGKTTFMNLLIKNRPQHIDYLVYFDAYEPVEEVIKRITNTLPIWKRIGMSSADRTSFAGFLRKRLGSRRIMLVFDETQDYDEDIFRWLRILNDRVENLFIVFLGLHGLIDKITAETALRDRKTKEIVLSPFTAEQLREIVVKRLSWVGGAGIKPFTEDGLLRLCESANGVPRLLLENGQKVVEHCSKGGLGSADSIVVEGVIGIGDETDVESFEDDDEAQSIDFSKRTLVYHNFIDDLSPTQQGIINLLQARESMSISEMSDELGKDIRSIGSLLRKLRGLNRKEVERKPNVPYPVVVRVGKDRRGGRQQYIYTLSDNARRMLTTS